MNIWLGVGAVVALVMIAVVVVGVRRPRHAEEELSQPDQATAYIQTPGPVSQAPLNVFLRSIQTSRGTGTLHVIAGGRTGSLYFLFGHLFHAVCGESTGEVAVKELLGWRDTEYTLDTKSPLPTEETITRPIDEIVAA